MDRVLRAHSAGLSGAGDRGVVGAAPQCHRGRVVDGFLHPHHLHSAASADEGRSHHRPGPLHHPRLCVLDAQRHGQLRLETDCVERADLLVH